MEKIQPTETKQTEQSNNAKPTSAKPAPAKPAHNPKSAPAKTAPAKPAPTKPARRDVVAILLVDAVSFLGILTETSMGVSFPDLIREFRISLDTVQWLTSGYLLVISIIMVASSFLNACVTARSLFRFGAITFILGSVLCIFAPNFPLLLTGRLLSAFAAGLNTPLMFNLVTELMPPSQRGYWMGVVGLVVALAPGLGPTVGGLVAQQLNWRAVFVIVGVLMAIVLVAGWQVVGKYHEVTHPRFDWLRFLVVAAAFTSCSISFNQLAHGIANPVFWGGIALTALLIAVFIGLSRTSNRALIDVNIFRNARFVLALVAYLLLQSLNIGLSAVVPVYAQIVVGLSTLVAGLILLPGSIIPSLFNPWYGKLYDAHGPRPVLLTASGLLLVGTALFGLFGRHLELWSLILFYMTVQFGFRAAFNNTLTYGIDVAAPQRHADATAVLQSAQQYAGSIGTTILTSIVALSQHQVAGPNDPRYPALTAIGADHAFWFTFVVALTILAIYLVLFLKKDWREPVPEPHEEDVTLPKDSD